MKICHCAHPVIGFLMLLPMASAAEPFKPQYTMSLAKGASSPPAKLANVSWMQGAWTGTGFGSDVEEVWSGPRGSCMMGMCRITQGGKVLFFEILTISEEKGSLVLRLKHFHPDLKGWEDRDQVQTFPLVKIEPNAAWFDGMTFRKEPDGSMRAWVHIKGRNSKEREIEFHYHRPAAENTPR